MIGDEVVKVDSTGSEVYGFKDLWAKVKAAAKKLDDKIRPQIIKILNDNKPKIIDDLNRLKETIVGIGKQIFVVVKNGVVEVVIGEVFTMSDPEMDDAAYGFRDIWAKVKEAASKLGNDVKAIVMKQIEDAKPQIIEQLNKMKVVVVNGVKQVLIEIVDDVVKMMIGDEVVKVDSTGSEVYGFKDLWAKVKAAAKKLDDKIRPQIIKILNDNKPK